MPIYEYRCTRCGKEFEVFQKITDPPKKRCPTCSGRAVRLISNSSFILKGSGWYATEYARKDKKGEEKEKAPELKEELGGGK